MNESHYPANSFFWLVTPWVDMDCHDKLYIQDHRVCAYGSDRPKLTRLCANFLEVFTINLQCPGIPAPDSRAFVRQLQPVSRTSQKFPGNNLRTSRKTARNPPEPCRELHRNLSETLQNLPGNCTGTCPKPTGTFLGTVQELTVGELTLDLSPPERNFSNRPEPPFELPGKPTGTLPGTAREPV